jgi:hypothetical protein
MTPPYEANQDQAEFSCTERVHGGMHQKLQEHLALQASSSSQFTVTRHNGDSNKYLQTGQFPLSNECKYTLKYGLLLRYENEMYVWI